MSKRDCDTSELKTILRKLHLKCVPIPFFFLVDKESIYFCKVFYRCYSKKQKRYLSLTVLYITVVSKIIIPQTVQEYPSHNQNKTNNANKIGFISNVYCFEIIEFVQEKMLKINLMHRIEYINVYLACVMKSRYIFTLHPLPDNTK